MTGRYVFLTALADGYRRGTIEQQNAANEARYQAITSTLDRDGIRWELSVVEHPNGQIQRTVTARGTAIPRRKHPKLIKPSNAPLTTATLRKRLYELLDKDLLRKSTSYGYGFKESVKSDRDFGRKMARAIAIVGKQCKFSMHEDMKGYMATAGQYIESHQKHSYHAFGCHRQEWKPVTQRYTPEQIIEIGYAIELLRLATERESIKTSKRSLKAAA